MRPVISAVILSLLSLPAAAGGTHQPSVEYMDEPEDRPPLDRALQLLYGQCAMLRDTASQMDKVRIDWAWSLDHAPPMTTFGWRNYVRVRFSVTDPSGFFDVYGPRGMSASWAPKYVEYMLGAGEHPGIAPRDLMASRLCGQPAGFDQLLPSPGMSILAAPPSDAASAPS